MAAWDIARAAIRDRLRADGTLLALIGKHPDDAAKAKVFDEDPRKGTAYPYVVVGEAVERPNNRMGGKVGRTVDAFVHAWSRTRANDERDETADRVDALLDNHLTLVVTGWVVELLNLEEIQYLKEEDSGANHTPVSHAILRFRLDVVKA